MSFATTFRAYYEVTKPGIIYGNLFTAAGAFFLASHWSPEPVVFVWMLLGLGFIIASASVFNNYFDRDLDAAMDRTRHRPSVTGTIAPRALLIYGSILGALAVFILYEYVNLPALETGAFGWFAYVVLYTLIAKRGTEWGTLVGSASGATPPVVGYVAATGRFDLAALVLFLMLVFWQMPHAYAIAFRRIEDYRAAGVPVLPIVRGEKRTKIEMFIFVVLFMFTAPYLTTIGAAGPVYGLVSVLAPLVWLGVTIRGFFTDDTIGWGKQMFLISLIVLTLLFVVMALDSIAY